MTDRMERVETILQGNGMHEPTCDYVTSGYCDYSKDHPGRACLVNHVRSACSCWLANDIPPGYESKSDYKRRQILKGDSE